jgi:hypothetical protein
VAGVRPHFLGRVAAERLRSRRGQARYRERLFVAVGARAGCRLRRQGEIKRKWPGPLSSSLVPTLSSAPSIERAPLERTQPFETGRQCATSTLIG